MTGATNNGQDFINRLREIVEANFHDENFGVSDLVQKSGKSHSWVHRYLKKHNNQSVSYFIRKVRLEKAMEMLLQGDESASEIAWKVGFGSPAYFNHCFHEHFGFPPGEARKRAIEIVGSTVNPESRENESGQSHQSGIRTSMRFSRKKKFVYVSFAIFIILGLFSLPLHFMLFSKNGASNELSISEKSIVVLPFKNLSGAAENQYFADGIAEDILNHLSGISELKVVSRTSAEQLRESTLNAREISRKLNVKYILEGSVRRYEDRVRISVQFVDARNDRHIWSENYDRQMTGIFEIQSEIAQNVATELQTILSAEELKNISKIPTKNPDAYNYYLQGRFFINKRTEDGMKKGIEYFEKAIETDSEYALAHAGLADAYFLQTWWRWNQRPEGYEKAKASALKALELDNSLAEAYATLGSILCYYDWEWEESRKILQYAIKLNPNYSMARQYYAELLEILDEDDEARIQINHAIKLDPVYFMHKQVRAAILFRQGKYDESLNAFQNLVEMNPENKDYQIFFFRLYCYKKEYSKAAESLQNYIANDTALVKYANMIEDINKEAGFEELLRWSIDLEQNKTLPDSYYIARMYLFLGDKKNALIWLEKAFNERIPDIPRINNSSEFDILRSEPRFLALIDKMGLTPYHKRAPK